MEIKEIETVLLSCPIPEENAWKLGGQLLPDGRRYAPGEKGLKVDLLIVKVKTDDGIVGLGESFHAGLRERAQIEQLKLRLIGADPFTLIHASCGTWPGILSGVNIACWDIVGKAVNRPLHELLGGPTATEVRPYASGGIDWDFIKEPEIIVREARRHLEDGFTAFKFRIPPDQRCLDVIRALRDAVGSEMDLMVEANMRFRTAKHAIRIARQFERYDPLWFEEPIRATTPADMRGYLEIRKAIPSIPVTGGEAKGSAVEFKPWIDSHAYDIVQPDASIAGLTDAKKIAYLAELEGIPCCPHNWGCAIANAANLHLVASIPNHFLLEVQRTWHWSCPPFRAFENTEILREPLQMRSGLIQVPKKPGLGIELNEEAFKRFPYRDSPATVAWDVPS